MLSVTRIQAYLGVSGENAYLTELEAGAVADVQAITGRWLGPSQSFVDVCDGEQLRSGGLTGSPESFDQLQSVRLSQPVAGLASDVLTSVEERGTAAGAWETVALLTTDTPPREVFEIDGNRLYRVVGLWPPGPRTVRVTFPFGYAVDGAPAAFCGVVLDLIASRYQDPRTRKLSQRITKAAIRGAELEFAEGGSGMGIPKLLYQRILRLKDR